jgi:hypothetical protein
MTPHSENLQLLLDELGPSTDAIVLIEQATPLMWLIVVEGYASAFALRLDDTRGIVTLTAELGRPQEATQFRIYEALLTYNGLADLHGGVRMALREPGGPVVQEFDAHLPTLQLDGLRQLLLDFSRKASAWEEIIESAEPPELDDIQSPGWEALRV